MIYPRIVLHSTIFVRGRMQLPALCKQLVSWRSYSHLQYQQTGKILSPRVNSRSSVFCCRGFIKEPSDESTYRGGVSFSYTDMEDQLFDMLCNQEQQKVSISKFISQVLRNGIRESDPRLKELSDRINVRRYAWIRQESETGEGFFVNRQEFTELISDNIDLLWRVFTGDFVIPDFEKLCGTIDQMYYACGTHSGGKVADYIPQLSRFSPDFWGVAICTVDGQRHSVGDTTIPFCLQSCSKPLTYALALNELGPNVVHQYVGQEPSGRGFNEISLDSKKKPHNPMINPGAIVTASLVKNKANIADRFDYVSRQYSRMTGGEFLAFNNAVYMSERETADRNFALAYYMRENKCFPEGTNLTETLELYFQMCSVEVTCDSASVIAATLANGGIVPTTMEKVVSSDAVRNTLSLMYSCGMYDYSGQFAFEVGLPAKSGVSGCVLLVVPNVMGICMWSPPLDELGNSVRGLAFSQQLVDVYNFHNYDNIKYSTRRTKRVVDEDLVSRFNFHNYDILKHNQPKIDPRRVKSDVQCQKIMSLLFGAFNNDLALLRREALKGTNMQQADYDGRTVLHIAAAEGHLECVRFLVEKCNLNVDAEDRWGQTALSEAERFNHPEVADLLRSVIPREGALL